MKKALLIILTLALLVAGGLGSWMAIERKRSAERLEAEILKSISADELKLILTSQGMQATTGPSAIVATAESRKAFLDGLQEYLSLAAEARREGMTEDPAFKVNFEYKKNDLLANLYLARLNKDRDKPFEITDEERESVWANPANEAAFTRDMDALRGIQKAAAATTQSMIPPTILQGEALEKSRARWARTHLIANMAKGDQEFMQTSELSLRLKLLEAGILSTDYLRKHWRKKIKATEDEIKTFLAANPKYDVRAKRATAEGVLQRAKNGEDFAFLAKEYSEHRPTKHAGGLFQGLEKGQIWPELESAALSLEVGAVADRLVETELGFHIVRLESKRVTRSEDGTENVTFDIRHIVLQEKFEDPSVTDPNLPPPFLSPEEIARTEIERSKRNAFVAGIVAANQISLPTHEEFDENFLSAK